MTARSSFIFGKGPQNVCGLGWLGVCTQEAQLIASKSPNSSVIQPSKSSRCFQPQNAHRKPHLHLKNSPPGCMGRLSTAVCQGPEMHRFDRAAAEIWPFGATPLLQSGQNSVRGRISPILCCHRCLTAAGSRRFTDLFEGSHAPPKSRSHVGPSQVR